jgi:hypothetical protein
VKVEIQAGSVPYEVVAKAWSEGGSSGASWSGKSAVWQHPLEQLSIWINGELMTIPFGALAGQGDISYCRVTAIRRKVQLAFSGGDAGEAYELTFEFRESKRMPGQWTLGRRIWRLGEFADTEWDETIYHSDNWDNPDM